MIFFKDQAKSNYAVNARIGRSFSEGDYTYSEIFYNKDGKVVSENVFFWNAPSENGPQLSTRAKNELTEGSYAILLLQWKGINQHSIVLDFATEGNVMTLNGQDVFFGTVEFKSLEFQNIGLVTAAKVENKNIQQIASWAGEPDFIKGEIAQNGDTVLIIADQGKEGDIKNNPNAKKEKRYMGKYIRKLDNFPCLTSDNFKQNSQTQIKQEDGVGAVVISLGYRSSNPCMLKDIFNDKDRSREQILNWLRYIADEFVPMNHAVQIQKEAVIKFLQTI